MAQSWIVQNGLPSDVTYGSIVSLNDSEFIIASQHNTKIFGCIYKYNIYKKEWTIFTNYPQNIDISHPSVCFDKYTNKVYVAHNYGICIYNINTVKWICYNNYCCKGRHLICTKGIVHLIGQEKHYIWNKNDNIFKIVFDFGKFMNYYISLIYVSSQNIILLIDPNRCGALCFWSYCLISNKWKEINLISNKWKEVLAHMSVITSDEHYIIIGASTGKIYILDIRDQNNYKLSKSKIYYPFQHRLIVRTSNKCKNELIIIGWIKNIFISQQFDKSLMPPLGIIKIISQLCYEEMIHCIERSKAKQKKKKGHYLIYIQDMDIEKLN